MTANEMIRFLMRTERKNQTEMAELIGVRNQSNVSETLKREIKASVFIKMANALGYDVYLVSRRNPGRKPNGFILTGRSESSEE